MFLALPGSVEVTTVQAEHSWTKRHWRKIISCSLQGRGELHGGQGEVHSFRAQRHNFRKLNRKNPSSVSSQRHLGGPSTQRILSVCLIIITGIKNSTSDLEFWGQNLPKSQHILPASMLGVLITTWLGGGFYVPYPPPHTRRDRT